MTGLLDKTLGVYQSVASAFAKLIHPRYCTGIVQKNTIQSKVILSMVEAHETRSYYRQASMRIHTMVVTNQRAGTSGRLRCMLGDIDKGELANRPSLDRRCWFSIWCESWTSQLWQLLELVGISRYLGPGPRPIQTRLGIKSMLNVPRSIAIVLPALVFRQEVAMGSIAVAQTTLPLIV